MSGDRKQNNLEMMADEPPWPIALTNRKGKRDLRMCDTDPSWFGGLSPVGLVAAGVTSTGDWQGTRVRVSYRRVNDAKTQ